MTGRNPFRPPKEKDLSKEQGDALDKLACLFEAVYDFVESLSTSRDLSCAKQDIERGHDWIVKSIKFYSVKK